MALLTRATLSARSNALRLAFLRSIAQRIFLIVVTDASFGDNRRVLNITAICSRPVMRREMRQPEGRHDRDCPPWQSTGRKGCESTILKGTHGTANRLQPRFSR